jgi:Undecaprenyl-phosphate galactose phosphotransferase WbaP
MVQTLRKHPELGLKPQVIVDDGEPGSTEAAWTDGVPVCSGWRHAPAVAKTIGINCAIVSAEGVNRNHLFELLDTHGSTFPHLLLMPDLHGIPSVGVEARDFCHTLALEFKKPLLQAGARSFKRFEDIVLGTAIAVAALPAAALICILIKLDSKGPAIYSHVRIGRNGRFRVWKFRSMAIDAEAALERYLAEHPDAAHEWMASRKLKHDPRVTRVGRFLRRTSLDELPQLLNVLAGQMSLVGPRPIVEEEIRHYGSSFSLYTKVTPGLTGLWQVSGRNDTGYSERVMLDTYYVRNWSPWLDVYILARTAVAVLRARGAY